MSDHSSTLTLSHLLVCLVVGQVRKCKVVSIGHLSDPNKQGGWPINRRWLLHYSTRFSWCFSTTLAMYPFHCPILHRHIKVVVPRGKEVTCLFLVIQYVNCVAHTAHRNNPVSFLLHLEQALWNISNFVEEAKRNGIKHIVKLSVMNADAQPGYAMGRLHRQEEKIIKNLKYRIPFYVQLHLCKIL